MEFALRNYGKNKFVPLMPPLSTSKRLRQGEPDADTRSASEREFARAPAPNPFAGMKPLAINGATMLDLVEKAREIGVKPVDYIQMSERQRRDAELNAWTCCICGRKHQSKTAACYDCYTATSPVCPICGGKRSPKIGDTQ